MAGKEKTMNMLDLQEKFYRGGVEKKLYWTLMREGYTHILPEIQKVLEKNKDCESIHIFKNCCILEKTNGVKLYFDFTQTMCRAEIELVMNEDPEREEMALVNHFLDLYKCSTVFDIGANVGMFSLDLYQKHQEISYYVFEPVPSTYHILKATAKLNNVETSKYLTYNIGFSDKPGTVEFFLPAENEAASMQPIEDEFYCKRSTDTGKYTESREVEKVLCQVHTVDAFVKEQGISSVDFVKIDVEGNEKFVLEGAKETLQNAKPLVYVELLRKHAKRFGYHPNEVIAFMNKLGYQCATIHDGELIKIENIDETTKETNFFFFDREKHNKLF